MLTYCPRCGLANFLSCMQQGSRRKISRKSVSTNDQQTLAMQNHAMREYAARRGWAVALQVREVNAGGPRREACEKLLEAAQRRGIDVVRVWRLDGWGRSDTDLLATLQELEHLGVTFVSLTEALDLTTPATDGIPAEHIRE